MKRIIFIFTLFFIFFSTQIHAARFGGGKSFGQHRPSHSSTNSRKQQQSHKSEQQHPQNQPPQNHNNQTPAKSSFASKILPALAGLSIGALLGSLLSGNGLAGGFGAILMILVASGIVFFIFRKLISSKRNVQPVNHFQNATAESYTYPAQTPLENNYQTPNYSYASNDNSLSFVQEEFLRTAKTTFIRMQNAYDNKNLADIRNFTTPEVFGEIQMQIQERGNTVNQTDVIHINASLLDDHEMNSISTNVLFSGQIREQQNVVPVEINEIWHFVKYDNKWLVAGIEQKNN